MKEVRDLKGPVV